MTYIEAINSRVSYQQVKAELIKNHVSVQDFLEEFGIEEDYDGEEVLRWLGY